jgi:hypothetical protein
MEGGWIERRHILFDIHLDHALTPPGNQGQLLGPGSASRDVQP